LPLVNIEAIYRSNFTIAIDCVNSVGGIAIPALLNALGVNMIEQLNCTPNGLFAHNPEPIPEHLTEIAELLKQGKADVGFVVDPDVDRLAIVCEDGSMFGEEYTLVSVADYVLSHTPGNTVSNMSSTRALRDVTLKYNGTYTASAVGEVNVVEKMKATQAIIGGEGNGGIIYPESHYGRDALVGIALFLSHLATSEKTPTALRATYPSYFMAKKRMELTSKINVDNLLHHISEKYARFDVNTIDGVKIDFPNSWVHLRKSNTEPIIRIYTEAPSSDEANQLADRIISDINTFIK
jgi:phosphomannomutase